VKTSCALLRDFFCKKRKNAKAVSLIELICKRNIVWNAFEEVEMKLIGTTMKHPHRHLCVATLFFLILSLSRRAEGLDLSLQSGFVLEGDQDEVKNISYSDMKKEVDLNIFNHV
jgi:hypothetical protein